MFDLLHIQKKKKRKHKWKMWNFTIYFSFLRDFRTCACYCLLCIWKRDLLNQHKNLSHDISISIWQTNPIFQLRALNLNSILSSCRSWYHDDDELYHVFMHINKQLLFMVGIWILLCVMLSSQFWRWLWHESLQMIR